MSLKESNDGLTRSWGVVSSLLPFYDGGKIEFVRDEENLATIYDGNFKIVNSNSGRPVLDLLDWNDEDREIITSFCMHPTRNEVVVATSNYLLRHFNLDDKTCIRTIKGHSMPIVSMCFEGTGKLLATGSADSVVRVWDLEKGYCTHNFRDHTAVVSLVKFFTSSKKLWLFSGSDDKTICVFDLLEQKCLAKFSDHYHSPTGFSFSPCGSVFVSTSRDKVMNFYDLNALKLIKTVPVLEEIYDVVILSPEHSQCLVVDKGSSKKTKKSMDKTASSNVFVMATVGEMGSIRLFQVEFGIPKTFECNLLMESTVLKGLDKKNSLQSLYYCPLKAELFVTSQDLTIFVFSINSHSKKVEFCRNLVGGSEDVLDLVVLPELNQENEKDQDSDSDDDDEESDAPEVSLNPELSGLSDGFRMAVVTNSSDIKLLNNNLSCRLLQGHSDIVLAVSVSPDGRYLISTSKDRHCRIWDTQTLQCVAVGGGHTDSIGSVACCLRTSTIQSKQGFFCTGGMDKVLKRFAFQPWKLESLDDDSMDVGALVATHSVRAHDKDVTTLAVSPNDSWIASGSQDKTIKLWKSSDLSLVTVLQGHRRGIWKVVFSPVDRCLLSCSGDRTLKLWSMADFSCLQTFEGHTSSVLNAIFINKGMQVVSSGADGLLRLWTLRTGECEKVFEKHADRVWALATTSWNSKSANHPSSSDDVDRVQHEDNNDEMEGEDQSGEQSSHSMNIAVEGCNEVFFSGGSDSALYLWKDQTKEEEQTRLDAEEKMLMMEQTMMNDLRNKRYEKALRAALELNHASKVLFILQSVLEEEDESHYGLPTFADVPCVPMVSSSFLPVKQANEQITPSVAHIPIMERLDNLVSSLAHEEELINRLFHYLKDWNAQSKYCLVAQSLFHSFLRVLKIDRMRRLDRFGETAKVLLSYSERHFARLDRLTQAAYFLDYLTSLMALYPLENNFGEGSSSWEVVKKMQIMKKKKSSGAISHNSVEDAAEEDEDNEEMPVFFSGSNTSISFDDDDDEEEAIEEDVIAKESSPVRAITEELSDDRLDDEFDSKLASVTVSSGTKKLNKDKSSKNKKEASSKLVSLHQIEGSETERKKINTKKRESVDGGEETEKTPEKSSLKKKTKKLRLT